MQECLSTVGADELLKTAQNTAYTHFDWPWVPNVDNYMEYPFLPELPDTLLRNLNNILHFLLFKISLQMIFMQSVP